MKFLGTIALHANAPLGVAFFGFGVAILFAVMLEKSAQRERNLGEWATQPVKDAHGTLPSVLSVHRSCRRMIIYAFAVVIMFSTVNLVNAIALWKLPQP